MGSSEVVVGGVHGGLVEVAFTKRFRVEGDELGDGGLVVDLFGGFLVTSYGWSCCRRGMVGWG